MKSNLIKIGNNSLTGILSPFGASIKSLSFNNQKIVLEIKDEKEFNNANMFFGKSLARIAGRIPSTFKINNKEYKVNEDEQGVSLHGGKLNSLSFKMFDYKMIENEKESQVIFSYLSKDNENGFPGNVDIKISYVFPKDKDEFIIYHYARSDQDTLINLGNHAYFNFNDKDINSYILKINSSITGKFKKDSLLIIGEEDVGNTFNFKDGQILKDKLDIIEKENKALDNYFIFDKQDDKLNQIELTNDRIQMCVQTSYEGCNIFVDSTRNEFHFNNKYNLNTAIRRGIAIECEKKYWPIENILLKKGEEYKHFIKYIFKKVGHEK